VQLQVERGGGKDDQQLLSTTAVKQCRRQEVLRLAELVMGADSVFPLTKGGTEGVAAALKAAELASGDQYLNELKLMHVEAGFHMEPWLLRVMALCKKAFTRNWGPVKRAPKSLLEPCHVGCQQENRQALHTTLQSRSARGEDAAMLRRAAVLVGVCLGASL